MVATRKRLYTLRHPLSARKINTSFCVQKYYPTKLLCINCNDSMNLGNKKKALLCKKLWLIDLNNRSFTQKKFII